MARLSLIDQLVADGLCPSKKLTYARIVMSDPHTGITNMVYRTLAEQIFGKITRLILNDTILYNRLRQLLRERHVSHKAFEELLAKAESSGIPLDVVLEIYERGMNDKSYPHLSPEEVGFNRINSFIAGGKASEIDADLLEWKPAPEMEWGTSSLANEYKKDTPGQWGKVKKALKK